jgi:hypothetical protein
VISPNCAGLPRVGIDVRGGHACKKGTREAKNIQSRRRATSLQSSAT